MMFRRIEKLRSSSADGTEKKWPFYNFCSLALAAAVLIGAATGRPSEAFANSPAPVQYLGVRLEHADIPDAAYVDILIPIEEDDYTENMAQAVKECGFSEETEAAGYREGGYVSYMFHHRDGEPGKILTGQEPVYTSTPNNGDEVSQRVAYFYTSAQGMEKFQKLKEKYPVIKLALLDVQGNILKISPECTIAKKGSYLTGAVTWDVSSNKVETHLYKRPGPAYLLLMILFLVLPLLLSILLTVVTETAAGLLFRIRPVKWIIRVNLVSNLIFNLALYLTGSSGIPYPMAFVLLEAAVIAAEWRIYTHVYPEFTSRRLLIFSVAANCTSMAAGYFLNVWYL
ncbi:hypothetical protein [Clostridium sp. AM58-1XD]|uniref:hypothetical protein n=1 Tax=Clostridium sp. AM58-1XD TaxID=2292307 RepID=UPI0011C12FBF|nr:hypothetical protein [Clostridium sp. AM58-1XD]